MFLLEEPPPYMKSGLCRGHYCKGLDVGRLSKGTLNASTVFFMRKAERDLKCTQRSWLEVRAESDWKVLVLEMGVRLPQTTMYPQQPEAGRGGKTLPWSLWGQCRTASTWAWPSETDCGLLLFRTGENILSCFKPPCLWWFDTAATRNQYKN